MSKVYTVLAVLLLAGLVGGFVFLAAWDIPPPLHPVEKDVTAAAFSQSTPAPAPQPGKH